LAFLENHQNESIPVEMNKPINLGQQFEQLREQSRFPWRGHILVATLVCLAFFIFNRDAFWYVVPLMVLAFLGFYVTGAQVPNHTRHAIRAIDEGQRLAGEITISITTSHDGTDYHAKTSEADRDAWGFDFSPTYWIPEQGVYPAELHYLPEVEWPVLAITPRGIIHPYHTPTKIKNQRGFRVELNASQ
jgi:hypothetical protein